MREGQKHPNQSASGQRCGARHRRGHHDASIGTRPSGSHRRGSPVAMAQTSSADTFDYSAINLHMAKQLVKDLLEAFDAEGNRTRLARALVTAQEKTDALMLQVTPLAIDIASEALQRWGIVEHEGDAFVRVMERISLLAPRDEELSFDVYQLHQKFLPVPPKELLEAEAKRVKEELRQQRRAAQQAKEEEEARAEARKKAEARQFARETFGEGTTA